MAIEEGLPYDNRTHERRPIPDPTVLTNQLVFREIGAVREIIETKIRGLTAIVDILQREVKSRPAAIDKAVNGLRVVLDERFKSISSSV